MGRKQWEKEKLLVTSNFSFSHSVFKRLVLQTRKNQGLFGKGLKTITVQVLFFPVLIHYQTTKFWMDLIDCISRQQISGCRKDDFCPGLDRKQCGKGRKRWLPTCSSFPQCFQKTSSKEFLQTGIMWYIELTERKSLRFCYPLHEVY